MHASFGSCTRVVRLCHRLFDCGILSSASRNRSSASWIQSFGFRCLTRRTATRRRGIAPRPRGGGREGNMPGHRGIDAYEARTRPATAAAAFRIFHFAIPSPRKTATPAFAAQGFLWHCRSSREGSGLAGSSPLIKPDGRISRIRLARNHSVRGMRRSRDQSSPTSKGLAHAGVRERSSRRRAVGSLTSAL